MEIFLICFFVLVIGACIGSFLNVVALRAMSGESIVFPNSKCPKCNTPIKWYDNIPIFSYFLTVKGKCRSCNEKISIQYPIVEAITSILFLVVFLAFGISFKTLVFLFLICMSIVLCITDIKEKCTYDWHLWIFIIGSIISAFYLKGFASYVDIIVGLVVAVVFMEILARGSYYLIGKRANVQNAEEVSAEIQDEVKEESKDDNEIDIDTYIQEKKRVFGEGDTYIAAAMGALLGWKYFLVAVAFAAVFYALCILPTFVISLFKQKEFKLLVSLTLFFILAIGYWILFNTVTLSIPLSIVLVIIPIALGIYLVKLLRNTVVQQGGISVPFGPPLILAMFVIYFWGAEVIKFVKDYIWMIVV